MNRTILHVDMDAFYAAVEQRDRPELRGKPVVVGAGPDERGVIAAASYEARRFGIHSAMPSREAGRLCPHATFLPVNLARYREVSRQVFVIFSRFTPLVEALSIDEAFLDVTGSQRMFGDGPAIARQIKDAIHKETDLTASVGVAANKFLAKLASDLNKPDGLTIVPSSREDLNAFLAPLPVTRIWGVGRVTADQLAAEGVRTIGDLQQRSERELGTIVGKHAALHLLRLAFGEDSRDVNLDQEEKSMSREHTFARDCTDPEIVARTLGDLVEDVGRRLRAAGLFATQVHLKLRWKTFTTITRQRALPHPCCDDTALRRAAQQLLAAEPLIQPVRLVGFGVSRMTAHPEHQLSLLPDENVQDARHERLSRTVDAIRQRHGRGSIRRASAQPEGTVTETES